MRNHKEIAYALMRVAIGVNIWGHGFFRILSGVGAFAAFTATRLDKSILPHGFVLAFGYSIPWIETILGLLLIAGFMTRFILAASAFFMITLTFGLLTVQDWGGAGGQLIYSVIFFFLLWLVEANKYSVDAVTGRE